MSIFPEATSPTLPLEQLRTVFSSNIPLPMHSLNIAMNQQDEMKYKSELRINLCPKIAMNRCKSLINYETRLSLTSNSSSETDGHSKAIEDVNRSSIKTETYYDGNLNPRIETVRSINKEMDSDVKAENQMTKST